MNQLERLLQKKRAERDKLDFLIQELERELADQGTKPRAARGNKRRSSVAALAQKVLEVHINGLKIPSLLAELEKLGYQTKSANPGNTVNSILHRAGSPFKRLEDGRWIIDKYDKREHDLISTAAIRRAS